GVRENIDGLSGAHFTATRPWMTAVIFRYRASKDGGAWRGAYNWTGHATAARFRSSTNDYTENVAEQGYEAHARSSPTHPAGTLRPGRLARWSARRCARSRADLESGYCQDDHHAENRGLARGVRNQAPPGVQAPRLVDESAGTRRSPGKSGG